MSYLYFSSDVFREKALLPKKLRGSWLLQGPFLGTGNLSPPLSVRPALIVVLFKRATMMKFEHAIRELAIIILLKTFWIAMPDHDLFGLWPN